MPIPRKDETKDEPIETTKNELFIGNKIKSNLNAATNIPPFVKWNIPVLHREWARGILFTEILVLIFMFWHIRISNIDYFLFKIFIISIAFISILENANHFLPKSFSEAPK